MPIALVNGRVLFFVHIPKCGGSSIEDYLSAKGRLALRAPDRNCRWSKSSPQHMERTIYERIIPDSFFDCGFIVLRDPMERLKSEFRMKAKVPRRSLNPINLALRLRGKYTGKRIYEYRFYFIPLHVDFDIFVRISFLLNRINPYYADNHLRPQVDYYSPKLKAFRFEDGFATIFDWIDIVTQTPRQKNRPHKLKGNEIEAQPSDATIALVRRRYAQDYKLIDHLFRKRSAHPKNGGPGLLSAEGMCGKTRHV